MNLYREFLVNVEELDQKRELAYVVFVDILSDDLLEICFHQIAQCVACKPAILDYRVLYSHIGDLPAFTDQFINTDFFFIAILITFHEDFSELLHQVMSTPGSS